MAYYPLFLDVGRLDALIVGAGCVGMRKLRSLCAAFPRSVLLVDPGLSAEDEAGARALGPVVCLRRSFAPQDLEGRNLVFAATGSRAVNAQVADLCAERDILCNCIDVPDEGSFFVPAHFTQQGVTVAVSTGGGSPALARLLREELEAFVGTRYTGLLALLARLRPLLLALGLPSEENAAVFRAIVRSPLAELLARDDRPAAGRLLAKLLPEDLHSHLGDLLHGN